jgi:hypothetical protein
LNKKENLIQSFWLEAVLEAGNKDQQVKLKFLCWTKNYAVGQKTKINQQ